MAKVFGSSFLAGVQKSQFNKSEWRPYGEAYPLKEVWEVTDPGAYEAIDGDTATVTTTTFEDGSTSDRITIQFKDGSSIDLKLSGRSTLVEGDKVKIGSITAQELRKFGQDPIVRYDGVKA